MTSASSVKTLGWILLRPTVLSETNSCNISQSNSSFTDRCLGFHQEIINLCTSFSDTYLVSTRRIWLQHAIYTEISFLTSSICAKALDICGVSSIEALVLTIRWMPANMEATWLSINLKNCYLVKQIGLVDALLWWCIYWLRICQREESNKLFFLHSSVFFCTVSSHFKYFYNLSSTHFSKCDLSNMSW